MPEDQEKDFQSDEDQENPSVKGEEDEGESSNEGDDQTKGKMAPEEIEDLKFKARQYDELLPNFTRGQQELARLKNQQDETERKKAEETEDIELKDAKQRAFKLLQPEIEKTVNDMYVQKREDEILQKRFKELEKEIDGKDGRPAFNREEIIQFAIENNLGGDPAFIYKQLYEKELEDWQKKQALSGKKKSVFSEKTSKGIKLPQGKDLGKMNADEFKRAAVDFLGGRESNE